jgi:protein-tyrosine phosphatase
MTETDISPITPYLYVSSYIDDRHLQHLREEDFRLIISMIGHTFPHADFQQSHCQLLFLKTYDTFISPIPEKSLRKGLNAALPVIEAGHKVLVYCRQGRRRSVTMAAAILIALGYTADEAMQVIKEGRAVADPTRFYVKWRIRQFEKNWIRKKLPHV